MTNPDLVQVLDLPRLDARLRYHGYAISLIGDELRGTWNNTPIVLEIQRQNDLDYLVLQGQSDYHACAEETARAVAMLVNNTHLMSCSYPVNTDSKWSLRTRVSLNIMGGISDQQLDDFLGIAISAIIAVVKETNQTLS